MRKAKWQNWYENDEEIKRWYDNLARGSFGTARERIRVLYRYCDNFNITPQEMVKIATNNRKSMEDQLSDFITKLEKDVKPDGNHYSPGYIVNYLKAVKSWLNYNGIQLIRRIKISNSQATPTIEDEQIPTKPELRSLLNYASLRGKVIISLIAFSGVRPQVMGIGIDGLKLKDIPELKLEKKSIKFKATPIQIIVPAKLSKTNNRYITFLIEEGMGYLKSYLEKRIAAGEKLTPNSPIITVSPGGYDRGGIKKGNKKYGTPFIGTNTITKEIRSAMRPRYNWRPYVLRAYFATQLLLAESQGKITHAYRQFMMGHKGNIEARYTTDKKLPPEVIEDLRRAYKSCNPLLATEIQEIDKKEIKKMLLDQWRTQAEMYGIPSLDIKIKMENKHGKISYDDEIKALQEEITKVTAPHLYSDTTSNDKNNDKTYKIVTESELVEFLNDGWKYEKSINDDKFLINKSINVRAK